MIICKHVCLLGPGLLCAGTTVMKPVQKPLQESLVSPWKEQNSPILVMRWGFVMIKQTPKP